MSLYLILEPILNLFEHILSWWADFYSDSKEIFLIVSSSVIHSFIHSLVFSTRGRSGGSQSPVMEPIWLLARCILGMFLGVVCHCFSPPLDVPTFAATCLCVLWNCGRERCPVVILPKLRLPRKFRDLLHAVNLRHGTDGFTSPPKEGVLRIFSP